MGGVPIGLGSFVNPAGPGGLDTHRVSVVVPGGLEPLLSSHIGLAGCVRTRASEEVM